MMDRLTTLTRTPGAVIYTRVSTGEQDKHGTSPDAQRDACRRKAEALGPRIVAEYHDGGISGGFLLARTEFQAALADIQAGRAGTLICPNISRYSRDVEHQQAVKKAVRAAGGSLAFCDMEFADTPEGDLNFTIQGGFAEYEKAVIRKRTMAGRAARAEEGRQPCRRPPYGYHIITNAETKCGLYPVGSAGQYLVEEDKAAVVRRLFADYAAGVSLNRLARALLADGIPTPSGAQSWPLASLRYVLSNAAYKGEAAFGKRICRTDESRLTQPHPRTGLPMKDLVVRQDRSPDQWTGIACPVLVSEDLWNAVQARFARNRAEMSGNPRRVYMLAGRTFCALCGGTMTAWGGGHKRADGSRKPPRYICLRHAQTKAAGLPSECSGWTRLVDHVETDVREALCHSPAAHPRSTTPSPSIARLPPPLKPSIRSEPR